MAGLGETCSHIAAILFYLEAVVRLRGTKPTCTEEKCQWLIPSYLKSVEYLPIRDIDFTSPQGKKRKLDEAINDGGNDVATAPQQVTARGKEPTQSEMETLFANLSCAGAKPLVLSLIPQYSEDYVPKSSLDTFPVPLKSLQQSSHMSLNYPDLLKVCETVDVKVTHEMAQLVEKETRLQSHSKLWYAYRAGRVTASRMKAVCRTNVAKPSQSLIKSICYPEAFNFFSKQTEWGCKHEKAAKEMYRRINVTKHHNLQIVDSGLVINPQWPFIGASPDGIVDCSCCERGVLEIKCPYCHRESSVTTAVSEDPKFCLKERDGEIHLDDTHSYYYQVQTQMFVCDVEYSDFCMCTFASDIDKENTHIERIYKNTNFWQDCVSKAEVFFRNCLLPELLGNWYTRPTEFSCSTNLESSHSTPMTSSEPMYCYCRGPEKGRMIGCDNPSCSVEWFHLKCLNLKPEHVPKGNWYCPDCQKLPQFLKGKKK